MALCTIADVETFYEDVTGQDNKRVAVFISAAQALIESYCNRTFDRTVGKVETLDGGGDRMLRLETYPLETVTTVVEDGDTLTSGTDFVWYPKNGTLIRLAGSTDYEGFWSTKRQSVTVTYTGGYEDAQTFPVPDDLRLVCATIAARIWQSRKTVAAGLGSASGPVSGLTLEGVGSVSYDLSNSAGQSTGDITALTKTEKHSLAKYRRHHIAGNHKAGARW